MDRRCFAMAAAGLGMSACLPQATTVAARPSPKGFQGFSSVELAIATICADGFANHHHQPAMETIPKMGFSNVELNLWYADQISTHYIKRLGERCRDAGLKPISLQGTSFGGEGRSGIIKDVSHKLLLIQHAHSMGCHLVKFTGSRRGTAGGLKTVIEVCKQIASTAEDLGVLVTLENHTGNVLETIEDYEQIFSEVDSPNVGLCLDTGHFEGSGIQLSQVVDRFADRILHVDLKDSKAFGKGHDTVVFGSGVTE
ncbi:MAG: sugar phosphate isomerase/epimerase family protein, partial [Planctomycetota bacterium]